MRKLILKMAMSLDGFVAGPNGEIDWLFRTKDDRAAAWTVERISEAGVHAMGSKTFRDMAAYWPSSRESFAAPMNDIPKVVFSKHGKVDAQTTRALEDAKAQAPAAAAAARTESWEAARWMVGDLGDNMRQLKAEGGKPIVAHGGAGFARSLVALDLVDELQLLVHPVALGRGLAVFSDLSAPRRFELASATAFPAGVVAHVYRRVT